jgi:hypothetical protein
MRLVIIESPFGAPTAELVERNKRYLRACIRDALKRGESPYASHRMLTDALDDGDPEERKLGIAAGFAWRAMADVTVVYTDLGISFGMQAGIEHATEIALARWDRHKLEFRRLGEGWDA